MMEDVQECDLAVLLTQYKEHLRKCNQNGHHRGAAHSKNHSRCQHIAFEGSKNYVLRLIHTVSISSMNFEK